MTDLRVAVVDDQALIRSAFTMLIDAQQDMRVTVAAADGREALAALAREGADAVLMDIRMPVLNGIDTIRAMRSDEALRGIPVLVLTTFNEDDLVVAALRVGANGFLLKDCDPSALIEAVRTVADGGAWLDPAVSGAVVAALTAEAHGTGEARAADPSGPDQGERAHRATYEALTAREQEVLELVCTGLSNRGIGDRLFMAESTVKTHVKAILGKTGTSNRVELIVHAFRTGMVNLG